MISKTKLASLALMTVAVIWGAGFIATQYAILAGMSAPLIMSVRFAIAALLMAAVSLKKLRDMSSRELFKGVVAGVILFLGFFTQTVGQANTNVSNCAFLTATNVIMVPFLVWGLSRRRPPLRVFLLAGTTLLGIALLTIKPGVGFSLNGGDLLTLVCALCFALHITWLGLFCGGVDARLMNTLQLSVCALLSLGTLALSGEVPSFAAISPSGLGGVLYLALFSTCICYWLQTVAQQHTTPEKAGIILCGEGLFGSVFSVILGMEPLTGSLLTGGLVIFGSMVCTEIDFTKFRKTAKESVV